jgi:hypothetical protein
MHPDRRSTADIDAVLLPAAPVRAMAATMAVERDLPADWLNDAAVAYVPLVGLSDWHEIFRVGDVTVSVGSVLMLLAMKLRANRGRRDTDDIEYLLGECGVTSVEDAQEIYERLPFWARKRRTSSATAVRQAEGDLDRALTWLATEDATVTRLAAVVDADTTQHGIGEERARQRRYNTWAAWGTTDMHDPNPHTGKDDPRLQPTPPAWAHEPFTVDHDPPHRSHGRGYGISR